MSSRYTPSPFSTARKLPQKPDIEKIDDYFEQISLESREPQANLRSSVEVKTGN